MWFGETPKNIVATFRAAAEQNAVLLFDEADAIANAPLLGAGLPHERESNLNGERAPARVGGVQRHRDFCNQSGGEFRSGFERRIRAHVLFEIPGPEERARIWELQIHPKKTPLAPDVDFKRLAERYNGEWRRYQKRRAQGCGIRGRPSGLGSK
jgi:SpoVK/Ycf46/Vps4 family AAA+-type ATPase